MQKTRQNDKIKCSQCDSSRLVNDPNTGESVCSNCGLVLEDQYVSHEPEWRGYTQEEENLKSRVGMPISPSIFDKGLSTTIGISDRDSCGRRLPYSTRSQMWRLRRWQIRSRAYASVDRNLAQAMTELGRLSDRLGTPRSIKENAAVIYRRALTNGLVRGRSIAAIIAASLYAAFRNSATPRTLREIARTSLVDKKDVARCYRLLLRFLNIQMPISNPIIYVSKIANRAGISSRSQGLAIKILKEASQKRVTFGKEPTGLAAAALYIASVQNNEKKTQKSVAEAAGVTEVTVRNRYKTLKKELGSELQE